VKIIITYYKNSCIKINCTQHNKIKDTLCTSWRHLGEWVYKTTHSYSWHWVEFSR